MRRTILKTIYTTVLIKKEETMKKPSIYRIAAIVLFAAIALTVPKFAQAANTAAGVTISNQATVNYTVGTVPQTAVLGNTVTFMVDRVIYVTVTKQSDVTSAPSSTYQAIQFLVTNGSNTAMRFALSPVSKATNTWSLTGAKIYRDNNSNGQYDAGDTLYSDASTFGDIASGATFTVLVVGDIPATAINAEYADYDLLATAVNAGTTTPSIETAGTKAANLNTVMTIFGDAAGSATGDGLHDGKHSASGRFTITASSLTVSKTATVYSDPISGSTSTGGNPKAIPGAVVTYTVTVTNAAGGADATNVVITDDLSSMINAPNGYIAFRTQFDDGTAPSPCPAGSGIVVNNVCKTNTSDPDGADFTAGKITVSGLTVAQGTTATIRYQVVIQ
jgi:uncharacterized repeat protein (TIGR01451 family)